MLKNKNKTGLYVYGQLTKYQRFHSPYKYESDRWGVMPVVYYMYSFITYVNIYMCTHMNLNMCHLIYPEGIKIFLLRHVYSTTTYTIYVWVHVSSSMYRHRYSWEILFQSLPDSDWCYIVDQELRTRTNASFLHTCSKNANNCNSRGMKNFILRTIQCGERRHSMMATVGEFQKENYLSTL